MRQLMSMLSMTCGYSSSFRPRSRLQFAKRNNEYSSTTKRYAGQASCSEELPRQLNRARLEPCHTRDVLSN